MKLHNSILPFVIVACCCVTAISQQDLPAYPKMTNDIADLMAQTFFFCEGQSASAAKVAQKFPELQGQLNLAQFNFNRSFGDSVRMIDTILTKENIPWKTSKPDLIRKAHEKVDISSVTKEQATQFIATIERRAKGDIPSPFLETLLIYNPAFLEQPLLEFTRGFKQAFRTKDHPKSKGIDLQIHHPLSWKAVEGQRPNVVQLFTSEAGRGLETFVVLIRDLPQLTKAEIDATFQPSELKALAPRGAKVLRAQPITLDRLKAGLIVYDQSQQQLDFNISSRAISFVTVYRNKFIMLSGTVATSSPDTRELDAKYKKFEPLFRLIATSLVIQNQY